MSDPIMQGMHLIPCLTHQYNVEWASPANDNITMPITRQNNYNNSNKNNNNNNNNNDSNDNNANNKTKNL